MSNDKVKEVVVAKLLEAMEAGTIPWRKPWKNTGIAPQNITKYTDFMAKVGTISKPPASWKDLFFPEIHHLAGS